MVEFEFGNFNAVNANAGVQLDIGLETDGPRREFADAKRKMFLHLQTSWRSSMTQNPLRSNCTGKPRARSAALAVAPSTHAPRKLLKMRMLYEPLSSSSTRTAVVMVRWVVFPRKTTRF